MQSSNSSSRWHRRFFCTSLFAFTLLTSTQFAFSQSAGSDSPNDPTAKTEPDRSAPQVKLRLAEMVSSANAKVGQRIQLEVVDPVEVDGKVIIAAGAHAQATVTTAKRRGHNSSEGQLILTVESVSRVDGKETPLRSAIIQKGSGHGPPIFGPCTFPIPADPVGLFKKGTDVVIPKGTELTATVALSNS